MAASLLPGIETDIGENLAFSFIFIIVLGLALFYLIVCFYTALVWEIINKMTYVDLFFSAISV